MGPAQGSWGTWGSQRELELRQGGGEIKEKIWRGL